MKYEVNVLGTLGKNLGKFGVGAAMVLSVVSCGEKPADTAAAAGGVGEKLTKEQEAASADVKKASATVANFIKALGTVNVGDPATEIPKLVNGTGTGITVTTNTTATSAQLGDGVSSHFANAYGAFGAKYETAGEKVTFKIGDALCSTCKDSALHKFLGVLESFDAAADLAKWNVNFGALQYAKAYTDKVLAIQAAADDAAKSKAADDLEKFVTDGLKCKKLVLGAAASGLQSVTPADGDVVKMKDEQITTVKTLVKEYKDAIAALADPGKKISEAGDRKSVV